MIKLVTKKLNNLLKVTHLLSGRSKIWSKSSCKVCALLFGHATLTLCYVQGPRSAILWKLRVFRHKIHTIMCCFLGAFGTLWIGGNVAIISTISWESLFWGGREEGHLNFPSHEYKTLENVISPGIHLSCIYHTSYHPLWILGQTQYTLPKKEADTFS